MMQFSIPYGTYVIQLQYETNCCGISLPSTISLVVEETPNIAASSDQQFCLGTFGGVQLSVSGAPANASIQWTPTTGLSNFNTPTVNALPSSTTTYTVTVANASGLCASTYDVLVSVTDLNIQVNTTSATCAVLGSVTAALVEEVTIIAIRGLMAELAILLMAYKQVIIP
ncbi:MAG: hypothetical protein R2772_02845 [Chitinophagales bacterium]